MCPVGFPTHGARLSFRGTVSACQRGLSVRRSRPDSRKSCEIHQLLSVGFENRYISLRTISRHREMMYLFGEAISNAVLIFFVTQYVFLFLCLKIIFIIFSNY